MLECVINRQGTGNDRIIQIAGHVYETGETLLEVVSTMPSGLHDKPESLGHGLVNVHAIQVVSVVLEWTVLFCVGPTWGASGGGVTQSKLQRRPRSHA